MLLLAGCSSGDYRSPEGDAAPRTAITPSTTATSTTATSTTRPSGTTSSSATTVAEITVRGVVGGTFASARVISLRAPVSGFVNIALTNETEIVRANGSRATLGEITAGAEVEATGRRSTQDTLLARRVVLLN